MKTKKFLIIWVIFTGIFFTSAISVNYFTDPYRLYDTYKATNINAIKPVAGTHSRQSKIYAARKKNPDVLVVGNSRPELGIDPQHEFFQQNNLKTYNMGIPGSSLKMQYGYALDLIRDQNIKTIFIGIDFADYMNHPDRISDPFQWPPKVQEFDNRKKYNWDGSENPAFHSQYLKDLYLPLISLGTLKDSIFTLINQKETAKNLTEHGFNTQNNIAHASKTEGIRILFNQKNKEMTARFNKTEWQTFTTGYQWSGEFETLNFLLKQLRSRNIKTYLFINPYHAHYLKIMEMANLEKPFQDWKRKLVDLTHSPDNNDLIELWDFSILDDFQSERILDQDRKTLKWFWEPAHYRKELGDIMIWNMMGPDEKKNIPSFGKKLTPATVETILQHDRIKLRLYSKNNPEEIKYLKQFTQTSVKNKP